MNAVMNPVVNALMSDIQRLAVDVNEDHTPLCAKLEIMKHCQCGCGGAAPIALRSNPRWGYVAGQPLPYIRDHAPKGRKQSAEERRARERRYYASNRERIAQTKRAYKRRRPDVYTRSAAVYREQHREEIAERRREYRKGRRGGVNLPVAAFEAMLATQQGRCAACCRADVALVIDHDHENGKVRGLLCRRCNVIAQHPDVVRAVLSYMEQRS